MFGFSSAAFAIESDVAATFTLAVAQCRKHLNQVIINIVFRGLVKQQRDFYCYSLCTLSAFWAITATAAQVMQWHANQLTEELYMVSNDSYHFVGLLE